MKAGYQKDESVKRVIIVGVATAEMNGNAAIYFDHDYKSIPDNDDWSSIEIKKLRVKPALSFRGQGEDARLHFNVNIPSNFFSSDWKFLASPRYAKNEGLHVKATGHGGELGFIDMNVEGRGAAGNSVVTEEGCAKWS